jgi:Ca2+/H+ antiporter, TMEM165/GDT1 family
MNLDKVIAGFFIIFAMTLNYGFWYGDPLELHMHNKYELFAAIIVNIIATVLKLGDKTQLGSVLIATSLVADLQLIAAASLWSIYGTETGGTAPEIFGIIISLSGGALIANITSVVLYVGDTLKSKR